VCLIPATAAAGECPHPHLAVLPADGARDVPTNVEVRVVMEAASVEVFELVDPVTRQIAKEGDVSTFGVVLRDAHGATIATRTRRIDARHPIAIADPVTALAANTTYAVVVHAPKEDYVVSHFTTGAARDGDAPALDKVKTARISDWPRQGDWKDAYGSLAEAELGGVEGAAGFELHDLSGDASPSDTTLRAVILSAGPRVRFGSAWGCVAPNFAIPGKPARNADAHWHVWVRAFDLAGNVSPMREMIFDLRHRSIAR
jgi:hypothetical protein